MFIKKKLVEIFTKCSWNAPCGGLHWAVHARSEYRLFGFIKWIETHHMAGPFSCKQEAKKAAKRLRQKHNLK